MTEYTIDNMIIACEFKKQYQALRRKAYEKGYWLILQRSKENPLTTRELAVLTGLSEHAWRKFIGSNDYKRMCWKGPVRVTRIDKVNYFIPCDQNGVPLKGVNMQTRVRKTMAFYNPSL